MSSCGCLGVESSIALLFKELCEFLWVVSSGEGSITLLFEELWVSRGMGGG